MAVMKKHPFLQIDFVSTVKLSSSEERKIKKWLGMMSEVVGPLLVDRQLIHSSWLSGISDFRISVLLCGEARIRNLNREHRAKDKVTDVLSFPAFDSLRTKKTGEAWGSEIFLGDLAICHQRTMKQAEEFHLTYAEELIHLFVHGFLHLLGYDHEVSLREEKVMEEWEKKILSGFSEIKKKGP